MAVRKMTLLAIFIVLSGCAGANDSDAGVSPVVQSPTNTIAPTVTNTPLPTDPPNPAARTIIPKVVQICPEDPEVAVADLGIDPNLVLLLSESIVNGQYAPKDIYNLSVSDG